MVYVCECVREKARERKKGLGYWGAGEVVQ